MADLIGFCRPARAFLLCKSNFKTFLYFSNNMTVELLIQVLTQAFGPLFRLERQCSAVRRVHLASIPGINITHSLHTTKLRQITMPAAFIDSTNLSILCVIAYLAASSHLQLSQQSSYHDSTPSHAVMATTPCSLCLCCVHP